jgi:predicted ribosomally synthesized peptide with SipW-like signal peptide
MTQRILLSLGVIAVVVGGSIAATGAFFSDTETSTGNTFTAGELDLKIDNTSYGFDWNNPAIPLASTTGAWGPNAANSWQLSDLTNQLFFSFRDLKPGDYGEDTISLHVQNDAWACMAMTLTGTPENTLNEAEAESGDQTQNEGELQNYLTFVFWEDDGDNVYEIGEEILFQGPASELDGEWQKIADSSGGGPLLANTDPEDASYIGKFWCFGDLTPAPAQPGENAGGPTPGNTGFTCDGSGDNNDAQTDGVVVDVEFYAEQARHNGSFLCSSLNPTPVVTTLTLAKAVLPPEEALDTDFTLIADGPTDISGIEGSPAVTNAVVTPGVYSLSESGGPGGETSIVWECSGNATPEVDNGNGTATVTIAEGEAVVCGVTNTYEEEFPT